MVGASAAHRWSSVAKFLQPPSNPSELTMGIETEHLAIRALDPNIVRGESARGHLYYSIQEVQQLCKLAFGCTNLV